jgi:hypothetical protein
MNNSNKPLGHEAEASDSRLTALGEALTTVPRRKPRDMAKKPPEGPTGEQQSYQCLD